MSDYNRNMELKINSYLSIFPAVVITGVRQCGKTTLAKKLAPNWSYFDLENPDDFDRITSDPTFFFKKYPEKVIIDEAQKYPELFETIRGVIDQDRQKKGRFILTGSSSMELASQVSESLAGRVGLIELSNFKTNEVYNQPLSAFYELFDQPLSQKTKESLLNLKTNLTQTQFNHVFLRGGYPEPVLHLPDENYKIWMDNYFATYINQDIRSLFPKLQTVKYRRFIQMLSSLSGQILNRADIARSVEVNEGTIRDYLEIANGSFVWRTIPCFHKSKIKSLINMPRGSFRDSGLLHHLLKIRTDEDLYLHPFVGRHFEHYVCEEIIRGLQATNIVNWDYHYFRTKNGAEVDLVLDGYFGLLPIEIKYGQKLDKRKINHLKKFMTDHNCPLGLVINQASSIEEVADNIIQIPIQYL